MNGESAATNAPDAFQRQDRGAKTLTETVGKEKNKLSPTDIGMIVTDFLDAQFAAVMDYNFTASVEKEFDEIAMGEKSWPEMIRSFYDEFHSKVDEALESKPVKSSQMHELGIDPKSGKPVFVKIGRFGPLHRSAALREMRKSRVLPV